jgi:outer membrane protein OmpA-like peptidoglycan-associated protein
MDSAREAELARLKKLLAQEEAARREAAARADQLAERLKQEEARRNSGMVDPKQAMLNAVYFDYDRSDLRADQQSAMDDNVQRLKEYRPSDMVVVEGHSDTRGTFEYNLALGARRAFAVREYLINAGIDADRIITVSAGASMPADPGNDENAWAKSRRVELKRQSASQEQVSNASDR